MTTTRWGSSAFQKVNEHCIDGMPIGQGSRPWVSLMEKANIQRSCGIKLPPRSGHFLLRAENASFTVHLFVRVARYATIQMR